MFADEEWEIDESTLDQSRAKKRHRIRMPPKRKIVKRRPVVKPKGDEEAEKKEEEDKKKKKEFWKVEGIRTFRFMPSGFYYVVAWKGYSP